MPQPQQLYLRRQCARVGRGGGGRGAQERQGAAAAEARSPTMRLASRAGGGGRGAQERTVPQLQELDLANNALGESGGVAVGEALKSGKVPQLQQLSSSRQCAGEAGRGGGGRGAQERQGAAAAAAHLANNALGESGGVAVGEALKSGKQQLAGALS